MNTFTVKDIEDWNTLTALVRTNIRITHNVAHLLLNEIERIRQLSPPPTTVLYNIDVSGIRRLNLYVKGTDPDQTDPIIQNVNLEPTNWPVVILFGTAIVLFVSGILIRIHDWL